MALLIRLCSKYVDYKMKVYFNISVDKVSKRCLFTVFSLLLLLGK